MSLCASAVCVRILAGQQGSASHQHPAACSQEDEKVGQEMSQNTSHTPDAVLTCNESVAVIQMRSESMEKSQSETDYVIWPANLGERNVRGQVNHKLVQVSCSVIKDFF